MTTVSKGSRRNARRLVALCLSASFALPSHAQQATDDDDLLDLLMPAILAAIKKNQAAPPVSESYSYDALGRIEKVRYSNGSTVTYTYDAAGNRKAVVRTAPTPAN
ncbi:RHS repeat domain-containing protein [Roseateles sp. UC29_93]|uniref:RHS repeat domain-containing protein n=1 Tax=Roseateles sp. UC29_93 TaxID=3350177 RepID=UPI00366E4C20